MFRTAFVIALLCAMGMATPATASTRSGTDLNVGLEADGLRLLFSGAFYHVSITNNGPQTLNSATVVVQLDPRTVTVMSRPPHCPLDTTTDRLTCTFGPLAVGATSTLTTWVMFDLPDGPAEVSATATLTASSPADTNAANNSATVDCYHDQDQIGFPPHPWQLVC
jgi:hypothetical protein